MARTGAVVVLHDDSAYLADAIASVRDAVPVYAFVSRLPWHGAAGNWEAAAEIAGQAGAEVVLGDWDNEPDHRRAALAYAVERGCTHGLIPDGDEIFEPGLLATLLKVAEAELADRVFVHWDTYWKSDRYVIRPREAFTPCIMLDLRVAKHEHVRTYVGGRPLLLSPEHGLIKHMSYAGSNERIWRKITTWSHREEVVPGWYENVWLGWDGNKLMRNLHPTHPGAYGLAERVFTAEDAEVAEAEFNTGGTENTEEGRGTTAEPDPSCLRVTASGVGRVSVVIPLHGGAEDVLGCLTSLVACEDLLRDVVVVDNDSPDDAAEVAEGFAWPASAAGPKLRVVRMGSNAGFAAACNRGAAETSGDVILFLNSDTVVPRVGLERLLEALEASGSIGAAGPYTNYAGHFQRTDVTYTSMETMPLFAEDFAERSADDVDTDMLVGFCLAVRRRVLDEVGSFDEAFGLGTFEDNDLSYRMRRAGYRLVIAARSFVHHHGSRTITRMEEARTAEDAKDAEGEITTETTESTEETRGNGSREDAKARSAEVGPGFLDRIDRITRRDCDHGAGLCRSGQRARRAVCSGLEVPVMAEPASASGKPGKGRPGPRRAAPTTPDALHPTPDRRNRTGRVKDGAACTWLCVVIYRLTTQQKSGHAARVSYSYNGQGFKTKEETPAGVVYSATYTTVSDGWLVIQAVDDALGHRTSYGYDAYGNVISITDACGKMTTFGYSGDGSTRLRTRQNDPLGRVTAWTYSLGLVETITDGRGLVTSLGYDSYGNVVTVTGPDGHSTVYGYDTLGRQVTATDPLGRVTTTTWDDGDNRTSVTNPAGERTTYVFDLCMLVTVVNPLNQETAYTYGRYGNKLTEEDALGHVTSWSYDNMGYLVSIADALGNVSTLEYNAARQHIADIDQVGHRTSYTYDNAGRRETVEDARNHVTTTIYNARSDVIAVVDAKGNVTSFGYDAVGRQVTITDALNHVTTTVYDDAGQAIAAIDAAGYRTTTSFDASGNRVSMIDALQHVTTWAYETNSNRLWSTENALGHRVTFSYDDAGQQTEVRDARGNRTTFTYDLAGRLETQKNPLGYVTTHLYDSAGRQTMLIDANGCTKTMVYDAVGRVVSILYANGQRATYQYDAVGRQTTIVDWNGTTTLAYSARGALVGKTLPGGLRLTMAYDSVGNRTTLTEPDGYSYTYGFDALNRCIRLRDPNAYVFTFAYDVVGRRTTLLDSTGLTRTYEYDTVGRLTTQIDYNGATPIVTFRDNYDVVGNRTGRIKDGTACTWVYDAIYRLTEQQKSGQAATFSYDNAGNILVKAHEGSNPYSFTYDAANRLVTSIQGASQLTTFTHDSNGNLTVERCDTLGTLLTWVYDNENRCLNEVRPSGANHTYSYAENGLRWSYQMGGSVHVHNSIWVDADVINDYIDGAPSARYDVVDGEVLAIKQGASRYAYVPDPLGSVNHLLDTSLNKAATYVY